ncbi:class II fructose-bisphosphate aldolase [Kitasatospora sp. NPDC090308]|uniref:class II fructose-bisphosphate aldolase n=1 Tax=Kitasatospora sp. NPDC090308 TaxID=3364082 RepID=UPI003830BBF6
MILAVTPDAAPDATSRVERFAPGGSTRVPAVAARAGGKGVHAARVLRGLGTGTAVTGPAVAVDSSHAMLTRDAALDFELTAALRAAVPVPLVLHGSSGVADRDLAAAVERGMTKANVATHLDAVFTGTARGRRRRTPRWSTPAGASPRPARPPRPRPPACRRCWTRPADRCAIVPAAPAVSGNSVVRTAG